MSPALGRLLPVRKSGTGLLHAAGTPVGGSVLDFWQWSASDLMSNATRGRLAEYIVYRAVRGAAGACGTVTRGKAASAKRMHHDSHTQAATGSRRGPHHCSYRYIARVSRRNGARARA